MNVLITGSSGFVGQNLLPSLVNQGFQTFSLSMRGHWSDKIPVAYDAVVHLAGKAHDTKNTSEPQEYFGVNTELTKSLFDYFLQSDARDFIYFSSVKAVADTVEGTLDELVVPNPQTPYGKSKWLAEQYLNSQPLPKGKRLFILRPCMIHGPGNKGNLNLLYNLVSKGIPWPLAAFENRRSFLSMANLLFVVKQILQNPNIPEGTYNLADDDAISTNDLIKLIGEARNKQPILWRVPRGLLKRVAEIGGVLHLPLNSERLKKLTQDFVVDNSKIKSVLKIDRLPISAREGLIKTLRSF